MKQKNNKIVIAGGGTGGHVFPAIAIAKAMKSITPATEILFFGAKGKLEMKKVPLEGFNIIGLPISGLKRKFSFKNFLLPFKILKSLYIAAVNLRKFKPDVVVGVGGYASAPVVFVSYLMQIPIVLQEQNSFPGLVNRIFANKVKRIFVAYDEMEKFFPKHKIVNCGNPVRIDIKESKITRDEAIEFFKLDKNLPVLLVVGGSLGALSINNAVLNSLQHFENTDIQIIWQTGKNYYETAIFSVNNFKNERFKCFKFIERMDMAYAACDIIVSRAGALAISEQTIVAKPVILVPSPNVTNDHQTHNANSLVTKNAAIMIKDSEIGNQLFDSVNSLINDKNMQLALSENIKKLAQKDADVFIANEIFNLCVKK